MCCLCPVYLFPVCVCLCPVYLFPLCVCLFHVYLFHVCVTSVNVLFLPCVSLPCVCHCSECFVNALCISSLCVSLQRMHCLCPVYLFPVCATSVNALFMPCVSLPCVCVTSVNALFMPCVSLPCVCRYRPSLSWRHVCAAGMSLRKATRSLVTGCERQRFCCVQSLIPKQVWRRRNSTGRNTRLDLTDYLIEIVHNAVTSDFS